MTTVVVVMACVQWASAQSCPVVSWASATGKPAAVKSSTTYRAVGAAAVVGNGAEDSPVAVGAGVEDALVVQADSATALPSRVAPSHGFIIHLPVVRRDARSREVG